MGDDCINDADVDITGMVCGGPLSIAIRDFNRD